MLLVEFGQLRIEVVQGLVVRVDEVLGDALHFGLGIEDTFVPQTGPGERAIDEVALQATSSVGSFLAGLLLCLFTTFFFLYDGKRIFRWVMNLLRSVPDLVIGLLFVTAVGLGPLAGVLAITLNTAGVLAKLFSEAVESIDKGPVEGVRATGASKLHEIVWGVIPQVAPLWTSFALYRFESNSRAATVLGLIGAGGIGQLLFESIQAFDYRQVSAIAIVIAWASASGGR